MRIIIINIISAMLLPEYLQKNASDDVGGRQRALHHDCTGLVPLPSVNDSVEKSKRLKVVEKKI